MTSPRQSPDEPCAVHSAELQAEPSSPSSDPHQRRALTEGDFLPGVCGQQEDQEGQGRDEHTGYEQVEAVVEGPAAEGHREGDVRVRLFTALIELLAALARDSSRRTGRKGTVVQMTFPCLF